MKPLVPEIQLTVSERDWLWSERLRAIADWKREHPQLPGHDWGLTGGLTAVLEVWHRRPDGAVTARVVLTHVDVPGRYVRHLTTNPRLSHDGPRCTRLRRTLR